MEYSIDREDRLALFQQLYQTIKDVLAIMPRPGSKRKGDKSDPNYEVDLNLALVMMPTLERTSDFLFGNSPSLPMLKFLEIVLTDVTSYYRVGKGPSSMTGSSPRQGQQNYMIRPPEELKAFFMSLLSNFVSHISYSLYEEVFPIFDKLLALTGDLVDEQILRKCIVSLVDKYTIKSKQHKSSLTVFMKTLMDVQLKVSANGTSPLSGMNTYERELRKQEFEEEGNLSGISYYGQHQRSTYFEVMSDFCYFQNQDVPRQAGKNSASERNQTLNNSQLNNECMSQLDFRGPADLHDLFVDKLQFFIDSLSLLNETHINLFTNLITHPNFKPVLLMLIEHGETQIRLKSHEILEVLTAYFVHYCPSKTVYEFEDGAGEGGPKAKSGALSPHSATSGENIMDAEFISHERLYISQIVIKVARKSLEMSDDCYLQFNALISLDFLFQKLLPVPTFANEQVKKSKASGIPKDAAESAAQAEQDPLDLELTLDIEALSLNEQNLQQFSGQMSPISPTKHECLFSAPELDVLDPRYLRMRMKLVLSLWPHIHAALNSPWSNIRSVCYGLICSIFKIDVADYPTVGNANFQADINLSGASSLGLSDILSQNMGCTQALPTSLKLKQIILPMLYGLLSSKESESKAGGLNILGSFCGLSYDFTQVNIQKHRQFFQRNSTFVTLPIWRLVYELQDDWDITIKEASVVLVQLCAPRNAICYFEHLRQEKEQAKVDYMFQSMPKVSLVYASAEEEEETAFKIQERPTNLVSSSQAKKAFAIFPSEKDRFNILESIKEEDEEPQEADKINTEKIQKATFEAFLTGKKKYNMNLYDGVSQLNCQQIEAENSQLEIFLSEYEPTYQAAVQASKPLTRKEQLKLELNMGTRTVVQPEQQLPVNFFVDRYSDDQIQEIISIFRNDFQPPKNLWIEKQPNAALVQGNSRSGTSSGGMPGQNPGSSSPDFYADIYAEAIEQFNQAQLKLQLEQQNQLQQQVTQGSSATPNTSQSSTPNEERPDQEDNLRLQTENSEEASPFNLNQENPEKEDGTQDQELAAQQDEIIRRCEEIDSKEVKVETVKAVVKQDESPQKALDEVKIIEKKVPQKPEPEMAGTSKSCQCGNLYMDDSKFCRKCGRARTFAKVGKKDNSPVNIDDLDFDNINLVDPKEEYKSEKIKQQKGAKNKAPRDRPLLPPKTVKNENKKQINNFFNEKAEQDSHAASSGQIMKDYLSPPPASNTDQFSTGEEDNESHVIKQKPRGKSTEKTSKVQNKAPRQIGKKQLELTDNDYFQQDDKQFQQLKPNTVKNQPIGGMVKGMGEPKSTTNHNSNSIPDLLPRFGNKGPIIAGEGMNKRKRHGAANSSGSGGAVRGEGRGIEASGGSGGGENMTRKTAQTFLSGLSKGYIQNIDNMKLIKSCLSGSANNVKAKDNITFPKHKSYVGDNHCTQGSGRNGHLSADNQTVAKNAAKKKIINKSFENLTSANRLSIKTGNTAQVASDSENNSDFANPLYLQNKNFGGQSTKNQKKKTTLSSSPKQRTSMPLSGGHTRKPSSTRASKKAMVKRANMTQQNLPHSNSGSKDNGLNSTGQIQTGGLNNLCDLNFFIKTIERDLSERFKNMADVNSGTAVSTPNSLLKKVEEQMRSLGIDLANSKKIAASVTTGALRNASPTDVQQLIKKLEGGKSKANAKDKALLPKLKLIALNQAMVGEMSTSHKNLTPSNISMGSALQLAQTVSPGKDGSTGAASSFSKAWRNDNTALSFRNNLPKGIKTHRDREQSNERSGRDNSSESRGSGAYSMQFSQPQMIMTDRSHRVPRVTSAVHPKKQKNTLGSAGFESQRQVKFSGKGSKSANKYSKNKILSPSESQAKENLKLGSKKSSYQMHQSGDSLTISHKKGSTSVPKSLNKKKDKAGRKMSSKNKGGNVSQDIQQVMYPSNGQSSGIPVSTQSAKSNFTSANGNGNNGQAAGNNTLLDLVNQSNSAQMAKQNPTKQAQTQRYSQKQSSTQRGGDAKVIEYYSPIQITGRFIDSSQLAPMQSAGYSTSDGLDNSGGSPPLNDQQKHNSAGQQNMSKKQGPFTGRDPRKPPMLQPTSYY